MQKGVERKDKRLEKFKRRARERKKIAIYVMTGIHQISLTVGGICERQAV